MIRHSSLIVLPAGGWKGEGDLEGRLCLCRWEWGADPSKYREKHFDWEGRGKQYSTFLLQ